MQFRTRLSGASSIVVLCIAAAFLAACASPQPKAMVITKKRSKEYFAESEYGVKASPRVAYGKTNLKRGGGRDQLGKPYKVRGRMYYPREDRNYKKVGLASWYGDAFHGRLTANGEVYDMTHLTAAHPTMPLPSYARVTNVANGNSVIVRVNDRGPYAHDRLIDLSSRAADMLDYKRDGTAKVKVEYVGRAPLEGSDDQYLMASYRPGKGMPDQSDGLPAGVMIAMNGTTPSSPASPAFPDFPQTDSPAADSSQAGLDMEPVGATGGAAGYIELPAFGPIAPERPERPEPPLPSRLPFSTASLSYAPVPANAAAPFAALEQAADAAPYIAAGTFGSEPEAQALADLLSAKARVSVERSTVDGMAWYSVDLRPDGRADLDSLLEFAWSQGASDAIAVRD